MANFRVASAIDDTPNITLSARSQNIIIQWNTATVTSDAELAALRHLLEDKRTRDRLPSAKSIMAFKMIQEFRGSEKINLNLH